MSIRIHRSRRSRGRQALDLRPFPCRHCGAAIPLTNSFCGSCGRVADRAEEIIEAFPEIESSPAPAVEIKENPPHRKRSKLKILAVLLTVLILAAAGAFAYWFYYLQKDFTTFNSSLSDLTQLTESIQEETAALNDPIDLEGFRSSLADLRGEIGELENKLDGVEETEYREALSVVVATGADYIDELEALTEISPDDVSDGDFVAGEQMAADLEEALSEAGRLEGSTVNSDINLDPGPLSALMLGLSDELMDLRDDRARVRAVNARRSDQLAEVESFTEQVDGIIARYSAARGELAVWIDRVDQQGATFQEGYRVLSEHAERRRALRDELYGVTAPDEFADDKAGLVSVMDQAIGAMDAAYRGIEEYQYDFAFEYMTYDQTPGWQEFESATDQISSTYSSVVYNYEAHRDDAIEKLSKVEPMPQFPEYLLN